LSISNLKVKFARIVDTLVKEREINALNFAGDLIALVNNRLINQGEDANGKKFPLYSENNLGLKTALYAISRSNKPSAKLKKGETSYKDIREILGLPTDKRTHVFTGDMLKSIDATVTESNKYLTIVEIKSKDEVNQKKLVENSVRMKINLLRANKKEREIIDAANQTRLQNLINQ
jgi:hypothetical protein